jgi:hypothetical protein
VKTQTRDTTEEAKAATWKSGGREAGREGTVLCVGAKPDFFEAGLREKFDENFKVAVWWCTSLVYMSARRRKEHRKLIRREGRRETEAMTHEERGKDLSQRCDPAFIHQQDHQTLGQTGRLQVTEKSNADSSTRAYINKITRRLDRLEDCKLLRNLMLTHRQE